MKVLYIEILRVIAIFFVVFNHTNQYGFFYFQNTDNPVWYLSSIIFSVVCKVAVPLFFMISGYLLLQKQETLKKLFFKRILRYIVLIVVMTMVTYMVHGFYYGEEIFNLREMIKAVYRGDIGTYWFLYSYMGILLMLPFLRGCVNVLNKYNVCYLVVLRMFIIGVLPIIIFVCLGYSMSTKFSSPILEQAVFYSLIGYYFGITENMFEKKKLRVMGIIVSMVVIAISASMTYYEYIVTGTYSESFLDCLLPIVCIVIWGTVRYYSRNISIDGMVSRCFFFVGDKALGIYLLEPSLRIALSGLKELLLKLFPDFVASIVWCILFVGIGSMVVGIIKRIPLVKKFI